MRSESRFPWQMSLLFAVVTMALGVFIVHQQQQDWLEQTREHGKRVLQMLALELTVTLGEGDEAGARRHLGVWGEQMPEFVRIVLTLDDGTVLAQFHRSLPIERSLSLTQPLNQSATQRASLHADLDLTAVQLRVRGLILQLAVIAALLIGVFSYLLFLTRQHRLEAYRRRRQAEALDRNNVRLQDAVERCDRSERSLRLEKERAQVTLHAINDAVVRLDRRQCVEFMNKAAENLLGMECAQVVGRPFTALLELADDEDASARDQVQRLLEGVGDEMTLRISHPAGGHSIVCLRAAVLGADQDRADGCILVMRDVTETRELHNELSHRARHDPVTGLLNRTAFDFELLQAVDTAQADGRVHTLCYLDLDQFKVVNDTSGHLAGDELLRQLGRLLSGAVRGQDVLARLGGDEFGLLLLDCPLTRAGDIVENIRRRVADLVFVWKDQVFNPAVSIGVIEVSDAGGDAGTLLSNADSACFAAKDLGRNRVHFFQVDDQELSRRHGEMRWVARLHQALRSDLFVLYAQPIATVNGVDGISPYCEILIRLRETDGSLTPPGAFLPAAERYDLIAKVDRWVVQQTFALLARVEEAGGRQLPACAINLSGASLSDERLLEWIKGQMLELRIPPQAVVFEITETAAITHLERILPFIRTLRDMGCRFALDDFGSGLSSFAYLKNLPVDFLKIDGGFVRNLRRDPMDRALVEAIHHIGRVMGLETIAEYVEDAALLETLREIGVDYAQGYGIARPRPLTELLERPEAVFPRAAQQREGRPDGWR